MALNPYDPCPCGSGKKYKWCCTGYFDVITKALGQHQQGQKEAALRTFEELLKVHGDKPQVWVFYAQVLAAQDQPEKSKEAIEKAFSIQPDFPLAYLAQAIDQLDQGNILAGLQMYRKAVQAFSPDAHDRLAECHEQIAQIELQLNRPVAARAALEKVCKDKPTAETKELFDTVFGENGHLPSCARKAYSFRPMTRRLPTGASTGKLLDAKIAFEQLAEKAPDDPAVWFNLGLCCAWLGEQPTAFEALKKSVELETDDFRAEEAAALIQVLLCGEGMENEADYLEHRILMQIRDDRAVVEMLRQLFQEQRIGEPRLLENRALQTMFIEPLPTLIESGTKLGRITGMMLIGNGLMIISHSVKESVEAIAREARDRLNLAVGEPNYMAGHTGFMNVIMDAMVVVISKAESDEELRNRITKCYTNYYENVWFRRPMRFLGGASPLDAVGSSLMRKYVLGALRFHFDCMELVLPEPAEENSGQFELTIDELRHKLGIEMRSTPAPGLLPGEEAGETPAASPKSPQPGVSAPAAKKREISAMNVAELSTLPASDLSVTELEDAMRTAIKLDARELAVHFARQGAAKPTDPARPDRYPFYACLMTGALSEGNIDEALRLAEEGSSLDQEQNSARRINEYGLRKATILLKKGDWELASSEYNRLIERNPDDGNLYVKASEAMLSQKQGARAAHFANLGIARAKTLGSRDLQNACQELLQASARYQ